MRKSLKRKIRFLLKRRKHLRRVSMSNQLSSSHKTACPSCRHEADNEVLENNLFVCPNCNYHHRIDALTRLKILLDNGEMHEVLDPAEHTNPVDFPDYVQKIEETQKKTALDEAVLVGAGNIVGRKSIVAIMSFSFMGGSMGMVVGERIAQSMLYAADNQCPCIIVVASGGARMQEGIFSLMQMAKTSHAAAILGRAKQPLFIVLTDPTTGGVTASFAMLGDIILAEPEALIGFAGPRVIEGTIKQKLPPGFQRSEFQKNKGFIDMIVSREKLRDTLAYLIDTHSRGVVL